MSDKPTKRTLIDIVADLRSAMFDVEAADGEVAPDLEAQLDALDDELGAKVDRCLSVAQELEAQGGVHKARAEAQFAAYRSLDNAADRLREYVRRALVAAEIRKLPTEHFPRLGLRAPRERTLVEASVFLPWASVHAPDLLSVSDPRPDLVAIKAAIKAGGSVPGCALALGDSSLSGHK